jgi:hypothetical protein
MVSKYPGNMSIWRTTPPYAHDFPIWAYVCDSEQSVVDSDEAVLLREYQKLPKGVAWTHANLDKSVPNHLDSGWKS